MSTTKMIVLGIDPGPTQSATLFWDGAEILGFAIRPNEIIPEVIANCEDNVVVACEHLQCMGMAVGATVFETAYWVGEFRAMSRITKLRFVRVMRSEVKIFWCGNMRARDTNIRQALIDRFGAPGTKKSPGLTYRLKGDLWSAFAIAAMVWDKQSEAT